MPRYIVGRGYVEDEEREPDEPLPFDPPYVLVGPDGQVLARPLAPISGPGPSIRRASDAATAVVSGGLAVAATAEEYISGQRDLPPGVRRVLPLAAPLAGGLAPVAQYMTYPRQARSVLSEIVRAVLRPGEALFTPSLEPLRRLRMGEPVEPWTWDLENWYLREAGRQLAHGIPGVGEREADLFQIGMQLAGGEREPRWWSLLAGVTASLLPALVYLPLAHGPAGIRAARAGARRAGARSARFVGEVAGPEVGARARTVFTGVADEVMGRRASAAEYIRQQRRAGRPITIEDISLAETRSMEALHRLSREGLAEAGLSPELAETAANRFLADTQWEVWPRWRYAGAPLGRGPTGYRPVLESLGARGPQTTPLQRGAFPEGAARMGARPLETGRMRVVEPATGPGLWEQWYGRRASRAATRLREQAEARVIDPTVEAVEASARLAKERLVRAARERVARAQQVLEEFEGRVRPAPEPSWRPAHVQAPRYEPTAREALAAPPAVPGAPAGVPTTPSPTAVPGAPPAEPQAPPQEPWAVQTTIFGGRETVPRRPEAPPPEQIAMDEIAGGYAVERPEDTAEGIERIFDVPRDVAGAPAEPPPPPAPPEPPLPETATAARRENSELLEALREAKRELTKAFRLAGRSPERLPFKVARRLVNDVLYPRTERPRLRAIERRLEARGEDSYLREQRALWDRAQEGRGRGLDWRTAGRGNPLIKYVGRPGGMADGHFVPDILRLKDLYLYHQQTGDFPEDFKEEAFKDPDIDENNLDDLFFQIFNEELESSELQAELTDAYDAAAEGQIQEQLRDETAMRLEQVELEIGRVEQMAAEVQDATHQELRAQGFSEEDARGLGEEAAMAVRDRNVDLYIEATDLAAAVELEIRQEEAAEGAAETAAAEKPRAKRPPVTLERLRELVTQRREAMRQAWRVLGWDEGELAPSEVLAGRPVAAEAAIEPEEILPDETPVEALVRETIEREGGQWTDRLRDVVRQAEHDRLRADVDDNQAVLEAVQAAEPMVEEFLQVRREERVRSAERAIARTQRPGERLRGIFDRWPGVRLEHRRQFERMLARIDNPRTRLLQEVEAIFGGRPQLKLGRMSRHERYVVTHLKAVRQEAGSALDELRTVLGDLQEFGLSVENLDQYLDENGAIQYDKLPALARRIFEVLDELETFYQMLYDGTHGLGPGVAEMDEFVSGFTGKRLAGFIEEYFPQQGLPLFGPEDFGIVEQIALAEVLFEPEAAAQVRRELRAKITERRKYPTMIAKELGFIDATVRGRPRPELLPEVDGQQGAVWYVHNVTALRTAYEVYKWLQEHGHTLLDFRLDAQVGERRASELALLGWGPPRPWGYVPKGMETYFLPGPLQDAINGIFAHGTAPAIFNTFIAPLAGWWQQHARPLQLVPLETVKFIGTQIYELFHTVVVAGALREPKAAGEGLVMANRLLCREVLDMALRHPPTSWTQEMEVIGARTWDRLCKIITDRMGLTEDDIDFVYRKIEEGNIIAGSTGGVVMEEVRSWTQRHIEPLDLTKNEAQAWAEGAIGIFMVWDKLGRTWAVCSLVAQGVPIDEAISIVREWSVSYDQAARRPWHDAVAWWMFYWRWAAERTEQFASLAYKRPGLIPLVAQVEEEREKFFGLTPGWAAHAAGRPPWLAARVEVFAIPWSSPVTRDVQQFLDQTKVLREVDGYEVAYMRIPWPMLDWLSDTIELAVDPAEELLERGVPLVRGIRELAEGREPLRTVPGAHFWYRARQRFAPEVWDDITRQIGFVSFAGDVPREVFERVAREGRTPERCRAPKKLGARRAFEYEVEKMTYYYLLERASRRWGSSLYTVPVTGNRGYNLKDNMTIGDLRAAIAAIDAGERISSRPSQSPRQWRRELVAELEQREGPKPAGPRSRLEQLGGIPLGLSRRLLPLPPEEVETR